MENPANGSGLVEQDDPKFQFRLYIAGNTIHSVSAQTSLEALCQKYWPEQYEIEIVDILQDPLRALQDCIIVTPTLWKLSPQPAVKVIGDLKRGEKDLLIALWLDGAT